eukprot:symbB.v1.2.033064.t1/scaffold4054.1/size45513/2
MDPWPLHQPVRPHCAYVYGRTLSRSSRSKPSVRRAKADVAATDSMDIPLSYALWPVICRLSNTKKATQAQEAAKRQLEKNLAAQQAVKAAEESEDENFEDPQVEPEDDSEDVEDLEDLDDAEVKYATQEREVGSFLKESDLDATLKEAAKWSGKFASRAAVLDQLLPLATRQWQWTAGPESVRKEDCPNPDGSYVARLAHGLESVVELRGRLVPLAGLPKEKRRDLRRVAQPEDITLQAIPPFVPAYKDQRLQDLAKRNGCRFFSSTSSLTGLLSRCYFAISRHRGFDLEGLSKKFQNSRRTFSPSTRWPTVFYLRLNDAGDAWSLTACDDGEENILMDLGLIMEYQLTTPKDKFDARFRQKEAKPIDFEKEGLAYRFLKVGRIMMRSQLDAVHQGQVFDVKTRAVFDIRHNITNYENLRQYRITHILGKYRSYELEIYEMMRNAFMKYGLQAKIGRMDGVIVAYHNTAEIFGFQYIPLDDMERCVYGGTEAADVAFDLCSQLLEKIMDLLTEDSELSAFGTIKVQLVSEDDSNNGLGNALDITAAVVVKEGEDNEPDELGIVRNFRILADTFHGDGSPRAADEALQQGDYVNFTVSELPVKQYAQKATPQGKPEDLPPWQIFQDFFSGVQKALTDLTGEQKTLLANLLMQQVARRVLCAVALQLLLCGSVAPPDVQDRVFKYRSYRDTHKFFNDLRKKYPNLVELWNAQEIFPQINPQNSSWGTCEGEPCQTLIVRIANKQLLTNSTPEVFFSGALHGDERVGPLTVTELAAFLCEEYDRDVDVRRLVDFRATWIMPMTNAHGYASRRREENNMDPNRDFPYLQRPDLCMRTQTARAVNELFRHHLFQFMITFHGGMRALTYEWGSRNHMRNRRSTESPDDAAFRQVGEAIQSAAGKTLSQRWFYPLGPINDLVYPVDGGMEDWSYAAGWETSPEPIGVCKPKTYGGYAQDRTKYSRDSINTLVYLAEMDDFKTAPDNSLGHRREIWSKGATHGHVARNMRMCLKLIELTRPEVVASASLPQNAGLGSVVRVQIYGFGCHKMVARLLAVSSSLVPGCSIRDDGANFPQEQFEQILQSTTLASAEIRCRGLSLWNGHSASTVLQGELAKAGEVCLLVAAEFDAHWGKQSRPDPRVKPRSHAARIRLESRYYAEANDGPMKIQSTRTKLFAVGGPVHVEATTPKPPTLPKPIMMPVEDPVGQVAQKAAISTAQEPQVLPSNLAQARISPQTSVATLQAQSEAQDMVRAADLLSVAFISFIVSVAVGCGMLACTQQEAAEKASAKDAQDISELAEMVGKPPE